MKYYRSAPFAVGVINSPMCFRQFYLGIVEFKPTNHYIQSVEKYVRNLQPVMTRIIILSVLISMSCSVQHKHLKTFYDSHPIKYKFKNKSVLFLESRSLADTTQLNYYELLAIDGKGSNSIIQIVHNELLVYEKDFVKIHFAQDTLSVVYYHQLPLHALDTYEPVAYVSRKTYSTEKDDFKDIFEPVKIEIDAAFISTLKSQLPDLREHHHQLTKLEIDQLLLMALSGDQDAIRFFYGTPPSDKNSRAEFYMSRGILNSRKKL